MKVVSKAEHCSVYLLSEASPRAFLVSTPETRAICNDPLVYGTRYTETLKTACVRTLPQVAEDMEEGLTSVVHLLRGGLNFGLREALSRAFGWNAHSSTFLSAQRRRKKRNPEEWVIGECEYRKLAIPHGANLILGDVVASGASLQYGIESMLDALDAQGKSLRSILFFTIGGPRSEEVFRELDARIQKTHRDYQGTTVVYFEGRFPIASVETPVTIKLTGTDLLRHGYDMTPEFLESQYESPMFPVERCTIYDAGSRAFEPLAYLEDVLEYWQAVEKLEGPSYEDYLLERFPVLDTSRFAGCAPLDELARLQIARLKKEIQRFAVNS